MRFSGPTIVVLVVLVVTAACEPALRPFRPPDKSLENPLLQLFTSAGIVVAATVGVEPAVGENLAKAVARALGRFDVPASTAETTREAILVESKATISENENTQPTLSIHWTLSDPKFAVSGTYETRMQVNPDRWISGSPALVERIAEEAARGIAELIHGNHAQSVATPARITMALAGIDGPFGDDNQSLLLAFRTVLEEAGVSIVDDPATATASLRGAIEVTSAHADRERIVIVWTLSETGGRTVGTLRQDNTVKKGELAARWGELVYDIAFAAADAIVEILKQIDAAEKIQRIGTEETLN